MSSIADRIARGHRRWGGGEACSCGEELPQRGCGCLTEVDPHTEHITALTEQAVRAQIAADIRAEMSNDGGREDCGMETAARIADGTAP